MRVRYTQPRFVGEAVLLKRRTISFSKKRTKLGPIIETQKSPDLLALLRARVRDGSRVSKRQTLILESRQYAPTRTAAFERQTWP